MDNNEKVVCLNKLKLKVEEIKGKEFVNIRDDKEIKKYRVINDLNELKKYITSIYENDYEKGIIVTCKCENVSGNFLDVIFLEEFKIDYCSNPQVEEMDFLNFQSCIFYKDLNVWLCSKIMLINMYSITSEPSAAG